MIITKTPYRLSLFGGGTDYPAWFNENGGIVIAAAMARYCYLSIRKLPPFFEHKTRAVYSLIENVKHHDEIKHPSIRHCLKYLKIEDGLEIHHDGDLPARSGIGSSSSFTVGLLHALHALRYEMTTPDDLSREAIYVEQNLIGESVGIQDQIMAAFGGLQQIEMGPGPGHTVRALVLPPEYEDELESHILLGFTGVSRTAEEFARSHVETIREEKRRDQLVEIFQIAQEAQLALKRNESMSRIGQLLDLNWRVKQRMSKGLPEMVNDVYERAKSNGAYGGKLMGAGGGGFMMFFAPPESHQRIRDALSAIRVWVPFMLDRSGSQVVFHAGTRFQQNSVTPRRSPRSHSAPERTLI